MLPGLGYEICSGGIIGMGESREDVVDMLMELREIQPEALPINFLLPIPGTPLEHAASRRRFHLCFQLSDRRRPGHQGYHSGH